MRVEEFLKLHNIEYVFHKHPAVYTCEEAKKYCGDIPGLACKNLFLQEKRTKECFLVILPVRKRLDFKQFATIAGVKGVSFASSELLEDKLGLEAGAVSLFGLLNDSEGKVQLYIDKEIDEADIVNFHPNVNTASIELAHSAFHKFLQAIPHIAHTVEL